ncbi:LysR family transcriptional regulator [Pseudomonas fluorescens]|uniref:LysR family transcriptional regulator n=1 Tax=Pseudomonas fluorescens TaxID=294 RepID=A0A379ICJ7_PSEFL|nr:LysR family transcriptional regulator [Pseudomonas fluorescens]AIG05568.1 LysR family transcriptional regulator [Pseudomonas fluorescens]SUD30033.1 LysR family transcriptional regulator [Pseudomonas fluorescens]
MDLNALRMFAAIAQSGSMTAAAEHLGIPLATISRRVRDLERELNVQLLQRSVHGTYLTDAGMRLYQHASRGLDILTRGERALQNEQARLKGLLRLSLPSSLKPWWEVLSRFQQRYPDIMLQVQASDRSDRLAEDGVDVIIRIGRCTQHSLANQRVFTYHHVLVAAPALLQRLGEPAEITDLHKFPCGVWSQGSTASWRLGKEVFKPDPTILTNDYAHLCSRALAGGVLTELPPFMAMEHIKNNQLVALLKEHPLPELEITLHYPSHPTTSPIVQAFLDFARQHIKHPAQLNTQSTLLTHA